MTDADGRVDNSGRRWNVLTNHGHVLLALHLDPTIRQLDLADAVGVTPSAVQRILGDLESEGWIRRTREGRRNRYEIDRDARLRHRLDRGHTVGEILDLLSS